MAIYIQYTIQISEDAQEILIAELEEFAESFEQESERIIIYCIQQAENQSYIEGLLQNKALTYELQVLPDTNWNAVWESNFQPVRIGNFCQIRADWHPIDEEVQHHFLLSPKMAFGTGHHATTYMMLERMETIDPNGKSILDLGCGTGILGVMAKKLGASRLVMVDVEAPAIDNSKEHAELNGVIVDTLILGTLDEVATEMFDLIYANIQKSVILPLLSEIKPYTHPQTILQISGILATDRNQVLDKISEESWHLNFETQRGEWCFFEVTRTSWVVE